jgi:hypothetical protein
MTQLVEQALENACGTQGDGHTESESKNQQQNAFSKDHPKQHVRSCPEGETDAKLTRAAGYRIRAQSADAARAYDLRSFLRSDRQYCRTLPDSSIKDRARVDQFGQPSPAGHDRYESSQRSDAETVLEMPQPGPCCRRTEGRSGMADDCQSYAQDARRGHIRDGCPDDRCLPGGAESFLEFRNRDADGSGAGLWISAARVATLRIAYIRRCKHLTNGVRPSPGWCSTRLAVRARSNPERMSRSSLTFPRPRVRKLPI